MWMPNAIIPWDHLFVNARLVMWEMVKIVQVRNSSVLWFLTIHRIHRGDRSGAPNTKMRYCKIKWQGFERCIYLSIWNEKSFGWYRQFSIILISASFNYEQTCEVYRYRSPPLSICTNVNAKHNVTFIFSRGLLSGGHKWQRLCCTWGRLAVILWNAFGFSSRWTFFLIGKLSLCWFGFTMFDREALWDTRHAFI